jgi:hypothetical protein
MPNVNKKKYLIFEQDDGVRSVYQVWRHKEELATWIRGELPISIASESRKFEWDLVTGAKVIPAPHDDEPRHAKSLVKFMERKGYTTKRINQRELEQYLFMEGLDNL